MKKCMLFVRGFFVAAILIAAFLFTACATTEQDIDKFADSVGGENMIADAVADPKVELDVRVYAVAKLIRLEKVELLIGTLKSLPKEESLGLVGASAKEIGKLFQVPDIKVQAAAKDTLYLFGKFENETVRKSAESGILQWYSVNFEKKYSAGKFSAFVVLTEIGANSGDLLYKLMEDEKNKAMRPKIAKIVEKINDAGLTKKISNLYVTWLNEQAPNFDSKLLQILCYARDDRVTNLLNNFVANRRNNQNMRINVLNTLTFHPSKLSIPLATRIFINRSEIIDLRGMCIEIIEKIGDKSILKYLMPFLRDEDVKWAAFKTILKIGGADVVPAVFKKLNPKVKFWRDDYDIARRHLKKLPKEAAKHFIKPLKSKHAPIVALALIGLQHTGDKEMAENYVKPLMGKKGEKLVIKNYIEGKKYTVADMAKYVYGVLMKSAPGKTKKVEKKAE